MTDLDETPRDPLREAAQAVIESHTPEQYTIRGLFGASYWKCPIDGARTPTDGRVPTEGLCDAVRLARAALASSTPDALDATWIDDLPGVTRVNDVTFDELMVPVSAIRRHFAARGQQ